ncbi:MAG: GntR family transcriptional regulator [Abditibacteriota bacterium]|nr:GntR family transcriptional regulator [Abditibacteriota bacterium]
MVSKKNYTENFIKDKIKDGTWTEKLPSEPILMDMIGVGRSTLREAISSLIAQKILKRQPYSGVFVRNKNKGKIIYFSDRSNSNFPLFYDEIRNKAVELLSEQNFEVEILYQFSDKNTKEILNRINSEDNDTKGIITEYNLREAEKILSDINFPLVNITTAIPTSKNNVIMDYEYMLSLACGMMNMHNHRDFAVMYIDFFTYQEVKKKSMDGKKFSKILDLCYQMANQDKNRLLPIPWTISLEEAYYSFKEWWQKVKKPAAIVFVDDALSSMASRAIGELNIKIPEELAIITIGDIVTKYPTQVPYTKIYYKYETLAHETVNLLLDCIENPTSESKNVYIKSDVKIGKSI